MYVKDVAADKSNKPKLKETRKLQKDTKHPKLTRRTPIVWKQSWPSGPQALRTAIRGKRINIINVAQMETLSLVIC